MRSGDSKAPSLTYVRLNAANLAKIIILLAVLGLLSATPFVLSSYVFYLISLFLIDVIVVVSFRFITLMGGWSLVHVGLWGAGAYATALLTTKLGWPVGLGMIAAAVITAFVGLMIAIPCLRTRGVYFILATFAIFEAIRQIWIRFQVPFGGYDGLWYIHTLGAVPYYYVILGVTICSLAIMYGIEVSRIGNAIKSVASDESLAESVGVNTLRYKVLAFVIGAFFVGLAGALFTHKVGSITPTDFTFFNMVNVLVAALLGGTGTVFGPIVGISLLTVFDYFARDLLDWEPLVLGFILICVILILPKGLESVPQRISALRSNRTTRSAHEKS